MSNWHLSSAATRLQSYQTTMELDPTANERRSSLHLRRLEHAVLAYCPNAGAPLTGTTWARLEQFLEMEVSALRALLGGRQIWSHSLSDRLHRLCQSGLLPLNRSRGLEIDTPAAFLRGSPLSLEVKDHLFGSSHSARIHGKDCRRGHYWAYYFDNAELAFLHLVSHPAFGAGIEPNPEDIDPSSLRVSVALKDMGVQGGGGCQVVVLLTWQILPRQTMFEESLPVGPDLAKEADAQRRRAVLCPRLASLPLDQLLHTVLCKDSPVASPQRRVEQRSQP